MDGEWWEFVLDYRKVPLWYWRHLRKDGSLAVSNEGFLSLPECIVDAQRDGFDFYRHGVRDAYECRVH